MTRATSVRCRNCGAICRATTKGHCYLCAGIRDARPGPEHALPPGQWVPRRGIRIYIPNHGQEGTAA